MCTTAGRPSCRSWTCSRSACSATWPATARRDGRARCCQASWSWAWRTVSAGRSRATRCVHGYRRRIARPGRHPVPHAPHGPRRSGALQVASRARSGRARRGHRRTEDHAEPTEQVRAGDLPRHVVLPVAALPVGRRPERSCGSAAPLAAGGRGRGRGRPARGGCEAHVQGGRRRRLRRQARGRSDHRQLQHEDRSVRRGLRGLDARSRPGRQAGGHRDAGRPGPGAGVGRTGQCAPARLPRAPALPRAALRDRRRP